MAVFIGSEHISLDILVLNPVVSPVLTSAAYERVISVVLTSIPTIQDLCWHRIFSSAPTTFKMLSLVKDIGGYIVGGLRATMCAGGEIDGTTATAPPRTNSGHNFPFLSVNGPPSAIYHKRCE
jgi:hypothetical protein